MCKLLEDYSEEIGVEISLQQLIDSHRNLRNELNNGQRKEYKEAHKAACERAYQTTLDSRYIEKTLLCAMTVQELSNLLCDGE